VLLLAGALLAQEPAPRRVVVGSKNFAESHLLGEIMTRLLADRTGLEVEHVSGLGGTLVCFTALTAGEIDVYPDYTGTGWAVVLGESEKVTDPLRTFASVQARFRTEFDVEWLSPFGFANTYAIAMPAQLAADLGVSTLTGLAQHAGELKGGFSLEFMNRNDGYPGLVEHYGFGLGEARGMEHALAYDAVRQRSIDLLDVYSTDGKLVDHDLVLLEDDQRFFPPYDAAPLARAEFLREVPEARAALGLLAFRLTAERMTELNHAVEVERRSFAEVAHEFLVSEQLLAGDAGLGSEVSHRTDSLLEVLVSRRAETLELLGQHLRLTLVAVLLAALIAVPLGLACARRRWIARLGLSTFGVVQTVPSLALLALLIAVPWLGLSERSAIVALALYAVLPILRNTFAGLVDVDPDLIDAARGMGMTPRQVLLRVQMPLATRMILAGVRTATVVTVGFATLAAFIGAGGLGEPILTGLYLHDTRLILSGALPAAALAVLVDLGLGKLERVLTPRGLRLAAEREEAYD